MEKKRNLIKIVFQFAFGCVIMAFVVIILSSPLMDESNNYDLQEALQHNIIDSFVDFEGLPPTTSLICIGPAKTGTTSFVHQFRLYHDMQSMGHEHEYLYNDCNSPYLSLGSQKNTNKVWKSKCIASINNLFVSNEASNLNDTNEKYQTLHDTFVEFLFTSYPNYSLKGFQMEWKSINDSSTCINPRRIDRDDLLSEYQLTLYFECMCIRIMFMYTIFGWNLSQNTVVVILIIIQTLSKNIVGCMKITFTNKP